MTWSKMSSSIVGRSLDLSGLVRAFVARPPFTEAEAWDTCPSSGIASHA